MSAPQPGRHGQYLNPGRLPHNLSATSSSATLTPIQLIPTTPYQPSRYDPVTGPLSVMQRHILPAGPNDGKEALDQYMFDLEKLPDGWKQYIHIDGKPYFHHEFRNTVTEEWIRYPDVFAKVNQACMEIDSIKSRRFPNLVGSKEHECYISLDPDGNHSAQYYFADHDKCSVFWLEEISDLVRLGFAKSPVRGVGLFLERNYYCHLENFPVHNKLPTHAEIFLRSALLHGCVDHMTSRDSATSPWNAEDCKIFAEILDGDFDKTLPGYQTWYVARLTSNILNSRWLHHYGMYEARTDRLASLNDTRKKKEYGFGDLVAAIVCFCAPYTYLERLENAWADRVISLHDWQKLLDTLLKEWSDANLLATVTLSSNMAFLALTDINSVSKTFSIISTLFAIGSIVVGLHHVSRHRIKADTDASQATTYLSNATKHFRSMKTLSFFLSLPLVLLSWSIITFAFSITIYAFYNPIPWWAYVFMGVVLLAVIVMVIATVVFFTETFSAQGMRNRIRQFFLNVGKSFFSSK